MLHLVIGEEFQVEQAVQQILKDIIPAPLFQSKVADWDTAIAQALIVGLGGAKFIWLKGLEIPTGLSPSETTRTTDHLNLIHITENVLVLSSAVLPDQRTKIGKWLKDHCQFQEFPILPTWKIEARLQQTTKMAIDQGLQLTPEMVNHLTHACNSVRDLVNALTILKLYQESAPLTISVVTTLVPDFNGDVYALANALIHQNVALYFKLLQQLNQTDAREIFNRLTNQIKTWHHVLTLWDGGVNSRTEVAQQTGIGNPNRLYFIEKELKGVKVSFLAILLDHLAQCELEIREKGVDALLDLVLKARIN